MILSRRQFFKAGCLTFGALGISPFTNGFLQRELLAGSPDSNKKLIFIFQNGGNDGINTAVRRGCRIGRTQSSPIRCRQIGFDIRVLQINPDYPISAPLEKLRGRCSDT